MTKLLRYNAILCVCLTTFFSSQAFSAEATDANNNFYFQAYHTNSFMYKHTHDDNTSSEINISVRYWFNTGHGHRNFHGLEAFFSYTGKYDFYWVPLHDTRPSGPVISRYQNPALHIRYANIPGLDYFDIGIEHISNGQSLDAAKNKQLVLDAYTTGNHALMDSISRTAAAIALTLEVKKKFSLREDTELEPELTLKVYAARSDQEANVFWGARANDNVDFNDYQLATVSWKLPIMKTGLSNMPIQLAGDISAGKMGLATVSGNLLLNVPISVFPLALSAHFGPMNNLSDYTKWQNTYAIGFAFAY